MRREPSSKVPAIPALGLGLAVACSAPPEPAPPLRAASSVADAPVTVVPASTSASAAVAPGVVPSAPVPTAPPVPPERPVPTERPVSLEARFAPIDTTCSRDSDCAVSAYGVSATLFCCDSCDAVAGSKAWVARADAQCVAYQAGSKRHPCPPRDCGPPAPARCNEGRCELVERRP